MRINFQETFKKLKNGLEYAYIRGTLCPNRDDKYKALEEELWKAKRLNAVGDENGVRITLRRVAEALPSVELKTPRE